MTTVQTDPSLGQIYIYLSRHGETVWNTQTRMQGRGDSPLTEKGIADACRLADALAGIPLLAAFCSPACRARQTTELALSGRVVPIIEDDRIQEMALGQYEGLTVQEAYQLDHENMDAFFHHPASFIPKGGESFGEVFVRISDFLQDLTANPAGLARLENGAHLTQQGCHILVISHNITIKTMLTIMNQLPLTRLREGPPIQQATLITVIYELDKGTYLVDGGSGLPIKAQ